MHDGPDEHDADLFDDGGDVIDCPACGAEIYAYAEQCPSCRVWLTMRHREIAGDSRARQFWWPWVAVGLVVVIVLVWVVWG